MQVPSLDTRGAGILIWRTPRCRVLQTTTWRFTLLDLEEKQQVQGSLHRMGSTFAWIPIANQHISLLISQPVLNLQSAQYCQQMILHTPQDPLPMLLHHRLTLFSCNLQLRAPLAPPPIHRQCHLQSLHRDRPVVFRQRAPQPRQAQRRRGNPVLNHPAAPRASRH